MSTFLLVLIIVGFLIFCMCIGLLVMWLFGVFLGIKRGVKKINKIEKVEINIYKKESSKLE